jgi:Zn-dependent alcohol dehydrogenase
VLVRLEASGVCHSDLHVVETGVAQGFDDLKAGDVIRSVILF